MTQTSTHVMRFELLHKLVATVHNKLEVLCGRCVALEVTRLNILRKTLLIRVFDRIEDLIFAVDNLERLMRTIAYRTQRKSV